MSHIFKQYGTVDLRPGFYPSHSDNRVYIKAPLTDKGEDRRIIGQLAGDGKFYPNTYFVYKFPDLWEDLTKTKAPPYELKCGLYLVYLAIGIQTGIYDAAIESCGIEFANAAMDYCMLNASCRSNSTDLLAEAMKGYLTFCSSGHTDEWYSKSFAKIDETQILQFKRQWIRKLSRQNHEDAWICVDASNSDCHRDSELCEWGRSKSGKDLPVVGYMWAVSAKDGTPITWTVNPGSMIDSKAVDETIKFLASNGIKNAGLVFDRGFCAEKVFALAREKGYSYVAMLKSSTAGYQAMMRKHSGEVRWKVETKLPGLAVFGTTDRMKVFANSPSEDCIGLFWDSENANERALVLSGKIESAAKSLRDEIEKGTTDIEIKGELSEFISIAREDGKAAVKIDYAAWQEATDAKGYSAIASSKEATASEIRGVYCLRDVSEKQYSALCKIRSEWSNRVRN